MIKELLQLYRRILTFVRPYYGRLVAATLCMVVVSAFSGVIAFLVKPVLDDIFINKDASKLFLMPLLVAVIFLLKGFFDFAQAYLMAWVGQRVIRDIRDLLYSHLQTLSLSFFINNPTGVLMARITNDVSLMQNAVSNALTGIIKDFFAVIFLIGVIFYRDSKLAVVAMVLFPLAFLPILKFSKKMRQTSGRSQQILGTLSSKLQETISGAKLIKAFGTENFEIEQFKQENENLFRQTMKLFKVQALSSPISEIFAGFGAAAVILYGGMSVINGVSTPGNFFSFITALFMLYEPVKRLSRVNNIIQQGFAGATRVFELLDSTPEVKEDPGAKPLPLFQKNIVFEDVHFRYNSDSEYVLKGANLDIRRGETVAIIGSSGAGKSTLVDLVPRFYDVSKGNILIDGEDIRNVTIDSLRGQIGIVSQHTILFNETIQYNISYGSPDAGMERIIDAAKAANAHDFIVKFPEGYATSVGEMGMRLSGGERQRIAIARALLRDSPILILDEATSALDSESEAVVQEALERLMSGRTVFVIAHRLSTIKNADLILVIEGGEISEQGTHDRLMSFDSRYKYFYEKQFKRKDKKATVRG
ncbi:MAG: ATP-binding cassette domain-containing protein [Deltaproteobacteria bacterium]|nr:ATP-binding cassette domain-containing protein [Deltaproteobacteria bacterium]NIS78189.1 ATP-binding cassette domain-containing protein [Deltaproteobacteria bacterium]